VAKLKAPLLSLGASGAIGKVMVFFNWKGLDVVREYIVPSNPQTTAQNTQRGYLSDAVANIHMCQAFAANPLDAADTVAYALLGSTYPTPRTWFNTIVKMLIDVRVAGKKQAIFCDGKAEAGALKITVTIAQPWDPLAQLTAGKLWYGTSKTALVSSVDCTTIELVAGKEITALTKGVKYYVQFRSTTPVDFVGANSGIFYATPT